MDLNEVPYLGECLSAAAPLAWAVAVILFRKGGEQVGPIALNLYKSTIGLVLIGVTMLAVGGAPWQQTSAADVWVLAASGVIGIAMADTLFFYALNLLGAARMAVVGSSYTPIVIGLSFVFLHESLGPLQWLGAALVLAAVVLASLPDGEESRSLDRRKLVAGAALGVLSLGTMACSVVFAKPALDRSPVLWASVIRIAGGVLVMLPAAALMPGRREYFSAFRPAATWKVILPGSIVGTYLAYVMWLGGIKYTDVSIAANLNQLHVLYTVILAAIFLRERMTVIKLVAVGLGLGGGLLVVAG